MKDDEGRAPSPATATTTIDSSTKEAKVIIAEPTDKIDDRRRWEFYWRRTMKADGYKIASATAEVDNIDRRVPSPFDISFAQARAMAAIHGTHCDCHPAPPAAPLASQRSRGAA